MTVFDKIDSNGKVRYYFRFKINNKGWYRAVPEATYKIDAEKAETVFKAELRHGRYDLADRKGEMSFKKFLLENFVEYMKVNRTGWKKDMSTVKHLEKFFGSYKLKEINPFLIEH